MTGDVAPTLDTLKRSPRPAWLWDSGRLRVVWANDAGVALWGAGSLFDLVERKFAPGDPGAARLTEIFRQLGDGQSQTVRLALAGASTDMALEYRCHHHGLNDGRPGLLVVAANTLDEAQHLDDAAQLSALEKLPSAVIVLERNGRVVFCNAAAGEIWGYNPPASLSEIVGGADTADKIARQAGTSGLVSQVVDIGTQYGTRPHRLHLEPLPEINGAQRYVLQLDDVGDRRTLEAELRADADRLADFVAAASTLTFELDGELHFSAADGDVPGDLVGMSWEEFSAAHGLDPGGAIASALAHHDAWRMTVAWPAPAGAQQIHLSAVPSFGPDGRFAGYRGVGAPVAGTGAGDAPKSPEAAPGGESAAPDNSSAVPLSEEDKAAFRQIAETLINGDAKPEDAGGEDDDGEAAATPEPESDDRSDPAPSGRGGPSDDDLRTILDTATDGVLTLDHKGRIASLNASAQAIFGYDTQEAVGRPIYDFLTAESATTVRDYLSALSDSGLARIFNDGREIVAVEKQGGEIPLFVTIGRIYTDTNRRGGKTSYCAVIRDITQWKRTEVELRSAKEQAERANAQKSEFLANISHELRTPLNAIIGFSEVMKTEKFGTISNDRYRGYVTDIHSSGEHLLSLINDLLDLSKVEAGKLELNFTSVDLSDIIQQCIGIIQEHATRERIIIRTSVADGLPNVVADQRSMRQILLNLLSNAVKFTDKGGQVIVSAVMDEDGQVKLLRQGHRHRHDCGRACPGDGTVPAGLTRPAPGKAWNRPRASPHQSPRRGQSGVVRDRKRARQGNPGADYLSDHPRAGRLTAPARALYKRSSSSCCE